MDVDSNPPAIKISAIPLPIFVIASSMDAAADAHCMSTVSAGTWTGKPASNAASRVMFPPVPTALPQISPSACNAQGYFSTTFFRTAAASFSAGMFLNIPPVSPMWLRSPPSKNTLSIPFTDSQIVKTLFRKNPGLIPDRELYGSVVVDWLYRKKTTVCFVCISARSNSEQPAQLLCQGFLISALIRVARNAPATTFTASPKMNGNTAATSVAHTLMCATRYMEMQPPM